ncbi:chemotaxis protein CheW [Desulfopila sp. IMCC35008]|uniref:chemotaxis protein CheW n=1 Tax=Desulfopila sp. IMCC35008 TaxID=2653858 RepID=UPI00197A97C2|nr:chemotaxis protein CheW [Desulfopila sp. IMCC35008]
MEETKQSLKTVELATFYIGQALCGMNILQIQEINKIMLLTPVPQAPEYVKGVLNLRGKIVTIIDLVKKLELGETKVDEHTRNIIVNTEDGSAGVLVSKISDVVAAVQDTMEKPPSNMQGIQGKYFTGVFKTENQLIGVLDLEKVLRIEE